MDRNLALAIARVEPAAVAGAFERHTSPRHRSLTGSAAGGRWGPQGAYPVLYLGRPRESIVVEAYRHLVEPIEGMRPELVGSRQVIRCSVDVTNILDLRPSENRVTVGLTDDDLRSAVADYQACHRVAQAAHQLGLHGVIAPAATGLGETLALFERRLPAAEQPVVIEELRWDTLPADPRRPRVAGGERR